MTEVTGATTVADHSPSTELPATMRAAVLFGPNDIRVVDRPVPRPKAQEVLVKVAMCGACGTDLKILAGHFPQTPPFGEYTPGHEWTGTVVAAGDGVDEFVPGDRVCIEAHRGCGRCDNCLVGRYTACLNYGDATKGHRASGMTANGGFAEYAIHHVGALYKLPPALSFEDAVLITTAGTGLYGLDRAGAYIVGQDVAIFGPGPVGLMTAQACHQMGAARVILVGTRESRLAYGRRFGATHTVNACEQDAVQSVLDATDGAGVDLAIEASGSPQAPQQCADVAKRGAKLLFVAFYPDRISLDLSGIIRKDMTMYTSRGEGGNNVKRAAALAAAGRLRGAELVSHHVPLDDIAEGFRVLANRDGDPLKLVVVPGSGR